MVSQSAQSSGWDDAGMDDEKRGSENDEKEREVQGNSSEDIDEGERWYQDVEKKGVYLKVMVPLSSSHVAEPLFIQPCKKSSDMWLSSILLQGCSHCWRQGVGRVLPPAMSVSAYYYIIIIPLSLSF